MFGSWYIVVGSVEAYLPTTRPSSVGTLGSALGAFAVEVHGVTRSDPIYQRAARELPLAANLAGWEVLGVQYLVEGLDAYSEEGCCLFDIQNVTVGAGAHIFVVLSGVGFGR